MSEYLTKHKIYAVRDRKSESFSGVVPLINDDTAKRMYYDLISRDDGTIYSRHPEDFDLYALGTFDPINGHVVGFDVPEFICNSEG